MTDKPKVIIISGIGCKKVEKCNWYAWLKKELEKSLPKFEIILPQMPDYKKARESLWLPFIKDIGIDETTILIGHSSGSVAIMRLLEHNKVRGAVLVSACHTDLGDEVERESGYYSRSWEWDTMKKNAQWIIQFASDTDPFIPLSEMLHVAKNLDADYYEYPNRGHFLSKKFPELLDILSKKLSNLSLIHI
eukprot:TRINITY_DN12994_c0_g1_i1.p1 TRINITY_DN12994_c0_g1~~TRINITY_DN12994_c0_g1_i1.p1  ORF type:complete len:191 (-),score=24.36 TRINITY_DN12994_c0_g1_i1:7-579(-)